MKTPILLLTSLLLTTSLFAQEQTGLVREQNSNKRTIAGVQVIFTDAIPTTSDNNGVFTLSFSGKTEGDLVFYEEIRKIGYEIVNKKELEVLKIGRTNQLGTDIILARAGLVDAAKKEYYDVSDDALIAGFNKEKQALRAKLQATQLGQEEYLQQLTSLQEQYEIQKQNLDALAAKFARINFDDVAPIYQEALELFKAGKVSQAITTLESAKPAEQTRKIIAREKSLTDAQKDLDAQKAELATEKQKQIATVRLLADMYNVNFALEKAEDQYDQLLLLDSTNLEILWEAADFYHAQHRYKKAEDIYFKIISHPKVNRLQIIQTNSNLGDIAIITGSLANALKYYELSFDDQQVMCAENPSNLIFKENLAIIYSRLGETHKFLGDIQMALKFFEYSNQISKEIYAANPKDELLKKGLAISYAKLGSIYIPKGELDVALVHFDKNLILARELFIANTENTDFKNGLVVSYSYLGDIHYKLGNLSKALEYYERALKLNKELYDDYPQNIDFKHNLAKSYNQQGLLYKSLGELDKSLIYYKDGQVLMKELYESFPQNMNFKKGLANTYDNLGEIYGIMEDSLPSALIAFESFNNLSEELSISDPKQTEFKMLLANSNAKIGRAYLSMGNPKSALIYMNVMIEHYKELNKSEPQNVEFKNGLAVSNQIIGDAYNSINNPQKALEHFQQYNQLSRELHLSSPDYAIFKGNLASSHARLGVFYIEKLGKKQIGIEHLQMAEMIWSKLILEGSKEVKYSHFLNEVRRKMWFVQNPFALKIIDQIRLETDTLKLYQLYGSLCDELRLKAKTNNEYTTDLAQALNSRAWYGFFLQEFEQVEQDIREGMALGTDNKYLATNLAPALLLQGKYEEALAAYLAYKDQAFGEQDLTTYRAAFLDDLRAFEAAGIIPSERMGDVNKIRSILKK